MKLTTRKDKPSEPIISMSECWAGLQLVRHILGRIVESGDAPEQVVERSHECFRNTLGCYARTAVLRAADAQAAHSTTHRPAHARQERNTGATLKGYAIGDMRMVRESV